MRAGVPVAKKNPARSRVLKFWNDAPDQISEAVKRWMRVQASSSNASDVA
jgi:hypothetical protein